MKRIASTADQKRAKNMVWSAAGRYDFTPEYLAYGADGQPDPYMNCVVGLAYQFIGPERLKELFGAYEADLRREEISQILWLGLENYAYANEIASRPVLAELRETYAREFLAQEKARTEVQWTQWSTLPHNLRRAHIRRILGEDYHLPSPREDAVSLRLELTAALPPEKAVAELRSILEDAMRCPGRQPSALRRKAWRLFNAAGQIFGKQELEIQEQFKLPRVPQPEGEAPGKRTGRRETAYVRDAEQTRREMEEIFGRSALGERALRELELELCTGNHADCRLWVTRGEGSRPPESIAQYRQSNRNYFDANQHLIDAQVRALTARLMGTIQPHRVKTPIAGRAGCLNTRTVWRAKCFPHPPLFHQWETDIASDFSVTLLLDGSESRTDESEVIAAQGYIVAESLRRCHIPVQVLSFCGVKGYTVMQILKPYQESRSCRGVLQYSAVGHNRDGLALRAAGRFLERSPVPGRILLVLTDTFPKDNTPIPSYHPLIKIPYEGDPAVEDTGAEIRRLREKQIRVGAVFMGVPRYVKVAARLYGSELAAVHDITGFPDAVGTLLEKQITVIQ